MTHDRILAVDIMSTINEAIDDGLSTGDLVSFSELLYAIRVCTKVILDRIPEDRRADYLQAHMLHSAEMLGIPLIPMEVDMPDKESMN